MLSISRPQVPAGFSCGLWTLDLAGAGRQHLALGIWNEAFALLAFFSLVSAPLSGLVQVLIWSLFLEAANVVSENEGEGVALRSELWATSGSAWWTG